MKKSESTDNKIFYVIVGTRAQLIKTAPVMKEFQDRGIPYFYIYTGQHKETIDDLRIGFGLKEPDIDLSIKSFEASSLLKFLAWGLKMLSYVFVPGRIFKLGKGVVLTHGDTVTCWWGALIGKIGGNKVAHLESGLRSFNIFHPFPEEINRLMTFSLTDYYFCPNEWALNNLKKFRGVKINTQGNTLKDAVKLAMKSNIEKGSEAEKYFVFSMHRFENIYKKKNLSINLDILKMVSSKIKCHFILHPVTRDLLAKFGVLQELEKNQNITFKPRMDFISFINLIAHSEFMITDGGSNQEECSYLGHPCLLLRKRTERIEGLDKNVVVSNYDKKIIEDFVTNYDKYKSENTNFENSPSKIIVDYLMNL